MTDISVQIILCWGEFCLVHDSMFSNIHGLWSRDDSSPHRTKGMAAKNKRLLGEQRCLRLRTTGLNSLNDRRTQESGDGNNTPNRSESIFTRGIMNSFSG